MGLAVRLEVAEHRPFEILPVFVLGPDVVRLVLGLVDRDRATGAKDPADLPEDRFDSPDVLHEPHQIRMVEAALGPGESVGIADAEIGRGSPQGGEMA